MMLSPYIAAIQIGSLQIQSQYARPTTAQVEVAPEPHNPILSQEELNKIIKPVKPLKALQAKPIAKVKQVPTPKPKVAQRASKAARNEANSYSYGYCTWHAKNLAPWVPNGWGDANMWASNARRAGFTVSATPIVGAVAQNTVGQWGHVAVVIAVHGSTVTISEANYRGWNVISTRTTPIGEFSYIY